jgi:small subunit ribosomal protein S2
VEKIEYKQLLEAGVHFGHLRKKWNPRMMPYIFMERKGIHIIDLNKTIESLEEAANAMKQIARSGKKILFVATKKQAKEIVSEAAQRANMPFVTERWLGGMLTNFSTIRKSIKKMQSIEKMLTDGTFENITKKEKLRLSREKAKMEKVLGGIAGLNRIPSAIFLVDIMNEHIALAEAKKLNIQTIGMVDTNSDPTLVDFAIPANDDATKSISIITQYLTDAMIEGLNERQKDKDALEASGGSEDDDDSEKLGEVSLTEEEEKSDGRHKKPGGKSGGGLMRRRPRTTSAPNKSRAPR